MEEIILQQVKCRVCNQTKPISEFVKDKAYKNGYRDECKECKDNRIKGYLKKWEEERLKTTLPKEKECQDCHQIKPVSDYTKDKYRKDGLSNICKDCKSKRHQVLVDKWKKERERTKEIPQQKQCIKCNRALPISEFGENINSKDGMTPICKECIKKRAEKYKERWKKERTLNPNKITKKECPSCHRLLDVSDFYKSQGFKDGLSFYCKDCELNNQKKHRVKWEKERTSKIIKYPKEKKCNICNRVLPASNFYKNWALKDGLHSTCIHCERIRSIDYLKKWEEDRKTNKIAIKEKKCAQCKKILPASMFYSNIRKKDGLTSICIDCSKKKGNEYILKWEKERSRKNQQIDFTLFPDYEKKCKSCNRIFPISMFYKKIRSKDGLSSNCIECDRKYVKEKRLLKRRSRKKPKIPKEKLCKKCNRTLPSSEFHKNCDSSDGLARICRDCKNTLQREYFSRPEVKKKLSEYKKEYRKRPGVREHERRRARKYSKRPYVKEKRNAYFKDYYNRPEVKERIKRRKNKD